MDHEKQLIEALEWFDDSTSATGATDLRLKDWSERFRRAKVWVRLGPPFHENYGRALARGFEQLDGEDERATVARLALIEALPVTWELDAVDVEPLDDRDRPLQIPPDSAFLSLWLEKPSTSDRTRAYQLEGQILGRAPPSVPASEERTRIGGRPGYVVRAPDFYESVWGKWEPNPAFRDLMDYVVSLKTYQFKKAEAFAEDLRARGFKTAEGKDFTDRSVRRLNIARELLLGSSLP